MNNNAEKQVKRGEAIAKLEAYTLDQVIEDITDLKPLQEIAQTVGVAIGSLTSWLDADTERAKRSKEARMLAAKCWDEKAEKVILEAKNHFELAKARELAHHYRWRASKIAPKDYGDKLAVTDPDGKALPPMVAPIFNIGLKE